MPGRLEKPQQRLFLMSWEWCHVQITPVLGVIQDLNARKARLAKGESLWPARAHLFFTTRGAAELGILQDSIVTEARLLYYCSSSLIHLPHILCPLH